MTRLKDAAEAFAAEWLTTIEVLRDSVALDAEAAH